MKPQSFLVAGKSEEDPNILKRYIFPKRDESAILMPVSSLMKSSIRGPINVLTLSEGSSGPGRSPNNITLSSLNLNSRGRLARTKIYGTDRFSRMLEWLEPVNVYEAVQIVIIF